MIGYAEPCFWPPPTALTLAVLSTFLLPPPPYLFLCTSPLNTVYMYSIYSPYLSLSWFPIHKNGCNWDKSLLNSQKIIHSKGMGGGSWSYNGRTGVIIILWHNDKRQVKLSLCHIKKKRASSSWFVLISVRMNVSCADASGAAAAAAVCPLLLLTPHAFKSHLTNLTHPPFSPRFPSDLWHAQTHTCTHAIASHLL